MNDNAKWTGIGTALGGVLATVVMATFSVSHVNFVDRYVTMAGTVGVVLAAFALAFNKIVHRND